MKPRIPAVQVDRLWKVLGTRMVLREVDLIIAPGELVVLCGDNGAGKTTLLRCLAGVARPTEGAVYWYGQTAGLASGKRQLIGLVTHENGLYPHLTARENLHFAARMYNLRGARSVVETWMERMALERFADDPVGQLSEGTRKRVGIIRGLIHGPGIVLLDEPFSGLDAAGRDGLLAILRDLKNRGCAICLSMHDLIHVDAIADRMLKLQSGRLESSTPPGNFVRAA
jgi:heme ABC exporter ATP-binding subunit CcmA